MDEELLAIAKTGIGAEVGLTPAQSARLVGETAGDLRRDAKAMAKELGLAVDERQRDEGGRFTPSDFNRAIRQAAGR
jgi:hypothetical protein